MTTIRLAALILSVGAVAFAADPGPAKKSGKRKALVPAAAWQKHLRPVQSQSGFAAVGAGQGATSSAFYKASGPAPASGASSPRPVGAAGASSRSGGSAGAGA